jgi:hypothetical protein
MGLKAYRLWALGQLDSTCRAPPRLRVQQRGEIREVGRLGHRVRGKQAAEMHRILPWCSGTSCCI